MKLFTIGFTQKGAEKFFGLLRQSGAKRIVDVRLNNVSQLAGFAKKQDLEYFAREICRMDYVHVPELAPTQELLDQVKQPKADWAAFERKFLALLRQRRIEDSIPRDVIANGSLLCSEDKPNHCHRRLVADYLKEHWGDFEVKHLV